MNDSSEARIERLEKRIAQLESTLTKELTDVDGRLKDGANRLDRAFALISELFDNATITHMLAFHAFYDWRPEGYKDMTTEQVRAWEIADRKAKRLAREQREQHQK